ncbi:hypothetical protein C1646_813499 [Rhizophagus diaphanus]|nr:hypothetical protein C1646_813499 [Rhizophagus diaphanus] [Rhizophagus sp. MUCL 43196]
MLSPSRIQTKFEENSPTLHSLLQRISVDIDTNKSIGHLKRAIKEQAGLAEPTQKLILWHVNIPENEKHKIYERINIEGKFGGVKLVSDLKTIGQEFKKQPPSEHIHIIVKLPATTGKRRHGVSDEENGNPKKEKLQQKAISINIDLMKNTNVKVFTVPVLPGEYTDTVIYNRSCYGYLRDFILNDTLLNRYCITGNPGIGFMAWIEPDGSLFKIKAKDHETFRQVARQKDVWYIIDSVNLYNQITQNSIKGKFNLCGGVARWIFDTLMTPDKIRLRIDRALSLIDLKSLLRAQGEHFSGDGFSHELIHIKTNEDINNSYTKAICTFASDFVKNKCLEKFHKDHIDDLRSFIEYSRDISVMAVLRGEMVEIWSHAKICKGGEFLLDHV